MKKAFIILLSLMLVLSISASAAPQIFESTLLMRLATRSGPSTKYTELGSFFKKGDSIKVLTKAWDNYNDIWWVQVEFTEGKNTKRAYTGIKRVDIALDTLPEEIAIGKGITAAESIMYLGPGYSYQTLKKTLPSNTEGTVIQIENGFVQFEYYDEEPKQIRRIWLESGNVHTNGISYAGSSDTFNPAPAISYADYDIDKDGLKSGVYTQTKDGHISLINILSTSNAAEGGKNIQFTLSLDGFGNFENILCHVKGDFGIFEHKIGEYTIKGFLWLKHDSISLSIYEQNVMDLSPSLAFIFTPINP